MHCCLRSKARQGAKVTLLECETIGFGGSGRNVGLVNAGLWLPPKKITSILGEKHGKSLYPLLDQLPIWFSQLLKKTK